MTATAADHLFIARTPGAGVLKAALEGRARDLLRLLMTDHDDLMRTQEGALFGLALALQIRAAATDSYIPSGRIGKLDLRRGVYTGYEVFQLAADDIASKGVRREVATQLRGGHLTVRTFLLQRYGVSIGQREYWHSSRWTPDEADLRDFLRMLRAARAAFSNPGMSLKSEIDSNAG